MNWEELERVGKSPWFQLKPPPPPPPPRLSLNLKFIAVKVRPLEEAWCHLAQSKARQARGIRIIHALLDNSDLPPNWGKISDRWVGSFQNMLSDLIRAGGWVGWCGGSCHNKGSREPAGPGWSHHSCLLPGTTRRNSGEAQPGTCKLQNKQLCSLLLYADK